MKKTILLISSLFSLSAFAEPAFYCYRDQYDMKENKKPILESKTTLKGITVSIKFRNSNNQILTFNQEIAKSGAGGISDSLSYLSSISASDEYGNSIYVNPASNAYDQGYVGLGRIYVEYANGTKVDLSDVECFDKKIWNIFDKL